MVCEWLCADAKATDEGTPMTGPSTRQLRRVARQTAHQLDLAPGESIALTLDDHYPDSYTGGFIVTRRRYCLPGCRYRVVRDH
jgi:hypothetical protein